MHPPTSTPSIHTPTRMTTRKVITHSTPPSKGEGKAQAQAGECKPGVPNTPESASVGTPARTPTHTDAQRSQRSAVCCCAAAVLVSVSHRPLSWVLFRSHGGTTAAALQDLPLVAATNRASVCVCVCPILRNTIWTISTPPNSDFQKHQRRTQIQQQRLYHTTAADLT